MAGEADLDHGNVLGDGHHGDNHANHDGLDLDLALQQRQMKRASLPARSRMTARHQKRLTLNFPINIPPPGTTTAPASAVPSLTSPGAMTPLTQSSARQSLALNTPLMLDTLQQPDDGSAILTAIASQERKVLELKEELQREEAELGSLKRQWVSTEKVRKQTVANHHAEQLVSLRSPAPSMSSSQPPPTPLDSEATPPGSATPDSGARRSKDLERRRSMRTPVTAGGSSISANGRRVFHGSHARMLSLLSAQSTDSGVSSNNNNNGNSNSNGNGNGNKASKQETEFTRPPRSATLPLSMDRLANNAADEADLALVSSSLENPTDDMITQWRKTMPPPSREALMRTGKQMASDLREGLWTFLEDIRQATVGEEGINATEVRGGMSPSAASMNRRSPSSSSAQTRGTSTGNSGKDTAATDIDSSFWNEFGIDTPGQKSDATNNQHQNNDNNHPPSSVPDSNPLDTSNDDLDEWNVWDAPQPRNMHTPSSSRSTLESKNDQSPRSQTSSPRTSSSTRSVNGWQGKLVCLSLPFSSPLFCECSNDVLTLFNSFGDWRPLSQTTSIPDPSVSDGIPWPAITKLAPSKLTRTASSLMSEWERSLSPSPDPTGLAGSSSSTPKESKKD